MNVDFGTMTIDLPLYSVQASAAPGAGDTVVLTCAVTHKFAWAGDPRAFASCTVAADGQGGPDKWPLVSGWGGPYTPHASAQVVGGQTVTQTYTVVRPAAPQLVPAGDHTFHLRVFDNNQTDIVHIDLPVTLPAIPVPSLKAGRIPRSLFQSDPALVESAGELQAFRDAGIDTLEFGIFGNPGDGFGAGGGPVENVTLPQWQSDMTNLKLSKLAWARANGWLVFLTGDDFCRNAAEKNAVNSLPWMDAGLAWLGQQLQPYADIIVGLEMQDESPDTASDPAYQKVINGLRAGWSEIPLSWPNQNWSGAVMVNEQPSRASYASRYNATDGIFEYKQPTAGELAWSYSNCTRNVPAGWPLVLDVTTSGHQYTKGGPGQDFNPATDAIDVFGVTADQIVVQVWTALAYGCCAIRGYLYDHVLARGARQGAAVGQHGLQTGVRPGDDRWGGLSAAMNAVEAREARLLEGYQPPVRRGPWLLGFRDKLSWAVNLSTRTEKCAPGGWKLLTSEGESDFPGGDVPPCGVVICDEP